VVAEADDEDSNNVYVPASVPEELDVEQTISFEEGVHRWKDYLTTSSPT
jgi:hypothetical protein